MPDQTPVKITVELSDREAWQLAQFCKRIGFDTVLHHTNGNGNKAEAYEMMDALEAVRLSLVKVGYSPR